MDVVNRQNLPTFNPFYVEQRTLGYRLQVARDAYGRRHLDPPRTLKPAEFARLSGFSAQAVSNWESDARRPDLETIAHLAKTLEVRAGWLAFGEEPMRWEDHAATRSLLAQLYPNRDARDFNEFLDQLEAAEEAAAKTALQKKKSPHRRAQ